LGQNIDSRSSAGSFLIARPRGNWVGIEVCIGVVAIGAEDGLDLILVEFFKAQKLIRL